MAERRMELLSRFLSGTIDFWTDSHRKQQFGCFVVDMIAGKYEMVKKYARGYLPSLPIFYVFAERGEYIKDTFG